MSQHVISALAVGPSGTVYAGSVEGADFKSVDGGTSWRQVRPVHSGSVILFIRTDPTRPEVVYAGGAFTVGTIGDPGGYLLKSTDAGESWENLQNGSNGLDRGTIGDLIIDPRRTSTLYTVVPAGFFRSDDGGSNWIRLGNSLPTPILTVLEIDPSHQNVIFAGGSAGVFRSDDAGTTFVKVSAGLPAGRVVDILVNPRDSLSVYAAVQDAGVHVSRDGGASWSPLNSGLTTLAVFELTIDPAGTFLHAATAAGVFDYQLAGTDTGLVLNQGHRFVVQLSARNPRTAMTSSGLATPVGDLAGYFSIPDLTGSPATPEVFVKVVDGRAVNGAFWFFHGALTDLEYTLTVTEEATGRVRTYSKPAGSACGGIDTSAFGP